MRPLTPGSLSQRKLICRRNEILSRAAKILCFRLLNPTALSLRQPELNHGTLVRVWEKLRLVRACLWVGPVSFRLLRETEPIRCVSVSLHMFIYRAISIDPY